MSISFSVAPWAVAGGGQRIGPYESRRRVFRGRRFGLSPDGEGEGWIDRGASSGGDRSAAESAGTAEALELVAEMEERERQQREACDVQPGMPPQELNTPPHTPPWSSQGQPVEPGMPGYGLDDEGESSDHASQGESAISVHASQGESSDLATDDEGECEAAAVQSQEAGAASSTDGPRGAPVAPGIAVLPVATPSGVSYYRGHYGRRLIDIDAWPEQQESDRWERQGAPPGPPQLQ